MREIILGIDGGGTHTTVAAADGEGHVLGYVEGGALNFNTVGMEVFRENLRAALQEAERRFGPISAISMGHSALDREPEPELAAQLLEGIFPVERALIHSDVFMALMGATLGESGVAVVAGTGSMAVAVDEAGREHVRGGWGYLLGDGGSGFFLGQRGMMACADFWDGIGPETQLAGRFCDHFAVKDPREAIDRLYAPGYLPSDMAAFAPQVLECAQQGDAVCRAIAEEGAGILAGYAASLMAALGRGDCTVGLFGGLFEKSPYYLDLFSGRLREAWPDCRVGLAQLPPVLGAVIHYYKKAGLLTRERIDRLLAAQ